MTRVSPVDAAFEGFRILRDRPAAVAGWAGANLLISLALALGGGRMTRLAEQIAAADQADPRAALALLAANAPLFILIAAVALLMFATFRAAAYRAVLKPEDSRWAYLRLGPDELRLAVLGLIYILIAIPAAAAAILVAAMGAAALGSGLMGSLPADAVKLAVLALVMFVTVRLSLAGPMTFAEGRIRPFASWKLTRGSFWRITFAYFLAGILALLIWLFAMLVYVGVALAATGGDLAAVGAAFTGTETGFTPAAITYVVVAAFLSAVQNAVLFTPGAALYRQLV